MKRRRLFTRRQKIALYIRSGGRCAECKKLLEPGWHADHIIPFSLGGETTVANGQATCRRCNLLMGNKMSVGSKE